VLPKVAWVVQTGANRVIMFRPPVEHYNPARVPFTGVLPGQGPGYGPPEPPPPPQPTIWRINAQVSKGKGHGGGRQASPSEAAAIAQALVRSVTPQAAQNAILPQKKSAQTAVSHETGWRPPEPQRFMTHDAYLEAWRAWQRATGNTNPPIRPLPGRVPPNFFGWRRDRCAPGTVLVNFCSGGTVLADGQNVVIAGSGFANITQAYSV
jgi:hypothetical protein